MSQLNEFKLKSFLQHLIPGIVAMLFGLSVLTAIVVEMATGFDAQSKAAYIIGIIFSALIVAAGGYFLYLAVHIHTRFLGSVPKDERKELLSQIKSEEGTFANHSIIVTKDYILCYQKRLASFVRFYRTKDLMACFSKTKYLSSTEIGEYRMILMDLKGHYSDISVKGDDAAEMSKVYDMILNKVPWVLNNTTDDRESFINNHKKESFKKTYIRTVEGRRKNMTETKVVI